MSYGWLTDNPPISPVTDQNEFKTIAEQIIKDIQEWAMSYQAQSKDAGKGFDAWDKAQPFNADKIPDNKFLSELHSQTGNTYVYKYGGTVVGLLCMESARQGVDVVSINYLLVHPGTEGGGATLVEYAVNLSQGRPRGEGKLQLWSLNRNSTDFYRNMGFEGPAQPSQTGGGRMTLDPNSHLCRDRWQFQGGRWQFKAYAGKKFAGELPRR